VTTPPNYPSALVASLTTGVRDLTGERLAQLAAGEADVAAAQAAGEDAENRRCRVAGEAPGLGALLPLPQPPNAAGVGKSGLDMPVIGEGYAQGAPGAFQVKSYGPEVPQYAPGAVGGFGYTPGAVQRHVSDLGDGRLLIEGASASPASDVLAVSPETAPKRSLIGRVLGKLRRR